MLNDLKGMFHWLADQPGFKKRITHSAAEYFNADNRTMALANYSRPVSFPSLPQVEHVLRTMPFAKRRNRAIVAFFLLTAARVGAVISARMGHVDIVEQLFFQDARDVHTKNSKTIETWFVPVRSLALEIFRDYHRFRVEEQLAGPADPLFPSTRLERVPGIGFQATGLAAEHWTTAGPVREILRTAFQNAGLRYYHPHTFRHLLSSLAKQHCTSLQDFQAWGQNIGHKNLVTTMEAYGPVSREEQRDLIRRARRPAQQPFLPCVEWLRATSIYGGFAPQLRRRGVLHLRLKAVVFAATSNGVLASVDRGNASYIRTATNFKVW